MADTKISDMAAVTETGNADLIPVVQGGVNKKATKQELFHGKDGEPFDVRAGSGPGAALSILTDAGGTNIILDDADDSINATAAGSISLTSAGQLVLVSGGGFTVDATYVPATPSDWQGGCAKVHEALDRLASVVRIMLAGPIP